MLDGGEVYFSDQNLIASDQNNEATLGTIKHTFKTFIH
jgi:hypothetical protein